MRARSRFAVFAFCVVLTSTLSLGLRVNIVLPDFAFGSGANVAASEIVQTTVVDKQTLESLKAGTLETKERRNLAYGALSRYLTDYLKGANAPEEKIRPFVQGVLKDFSKFVPSYRVDPTAENEARISLVLSTGLLLQELSKKGLRGVAAAAANVANANANPNPIHTGNGGAGSAGAANAGNSTSAKNAGVLQKPGSTFPYTALLVDEKNREIYVTPPEAVQSFALDSAVPEGAGFRFKPAAVGKAVTPSDAELNSVNSPLSQRATQFSNKFLFHLQNRSLVFKPDWSMQILSFLEMSARVARERGETRAWPPALPWSLSSLYSHPGLVVVFTVRSDDKSGALERIDVVGSAAGRLLRHYWSRPLHDPAYQELASKAIEKAAGAYSRLNRVRRPEALPGTLAFWVDRRVADREIVAVENILRGFALGEDSLLIPTEITKDDVRYQSPIPSSRADKVFDRLRKGVPGVTARLATGEPPVILLSPSAAQSSQPN
ncbi:MAG: hypothetical protein IOD12_14775 [Silvanigrellales bacterium]|nr:hypothetical protein [Silvanigrellales bacterium]